jgi:N-acetylglucosaminyldiphosphoundecaprenol N-acetyl-beta-D-mannosaminyltransferase
MSTVAQMMEPSTTRSILGVDVATSSYEETVRNCVDWGSKRQSRGLVFATVHTIMEAFDDPDFHDGLKQADMINPDGVPLVWTLRILGESKAQRVYGPDATLTLLAAAEKTGLSVGFYGGTQKVLDALVEVVSKRHPNLEIPFAESPPFRPLTPAEDAIVIDRIRASGAQLLFVGLGCPKQEIWVVDHLGRIPAVMLAVGAAFDFIAGTKPQAPRWMMRNGLEWVFRLATEPKRLAKRYLKHNPRFIGLVLLQLLGLPIGFGKYGSHSNRGSQFTTGRSDRF